MLDNSQPTTCKRSRRKDRPGVVAGVDGRTLGARAQAQREREMAEILGGFDCCNSLDRLMVQSAATLAVKLDNLRLRQAQGETVDGETLARVTTALANEVAALKAIGEQRAIVRPFSPSAGAA